MIKEFHLNILTPRQLASRQEAEAILQLLCDVYPVLMPDRYGTYQPFRRVFDPANPDELLSMWRNGIYWERRRPLVEGSVGVPSPRQHIHGSVDISIDAHKADVGSLVRFMQEVSSRLNADFAQLHFLTEHDIPAIHANKTGCCSDPKRGRYFLMVTTYNLRKSIPDLYWATILGPAYLEHFGRDRILTAPAPIVKELDSGCIYMQLSESPFDLETDYESVDAVRRAVKAHLNKNSFFDPALPEDHVYSVPEFHLEIAADQEPSPGIAGATDQENTVSPGEAAERDDLRRRIGEIASSNAHDAIGTAKELYNVELDFSEESVELVERILAEVSSVLTKDGFESQSEWETAMAHHAGLWGSYVGEVFRRHRGGEWKWDDSVPGGAAALVFDGLRVFPIAKVHKRLLFGTADDVWFYFQALCAQLSRGEK